MAGPLNAKVIMARCSKTKKLYGIRIEQRKKDWVRTWAFAIDEKRVKHEGFDTNTVTGSMNATDDFPGCPYCKSKSFVVCTCQKIGCWNGVEYYYSCPWCNFKGEVGTAENISISGGSY
jgi:hypothetical protein